MFVVVTGAPEAGKTTVSTALAQELGLPRLAKDTLKAGLLEVLDAPDVESSRRIGSAAVAALLAVAAESSGAVLDSVWVHPDSAARLRALPGTVIEVFCTCDLDELRRRYRHRAEQRSGRPYDFDLERPERELWNDRSLRPLGGGWPVITLDTTAAWDPPSLADAVRQAAEDVSAARDRRPPPRPRR